TTKRYIVISTLIYQLYTTFHLPLPLLSPPCPSTTLYRPTTTAPPWPRAARSPCSTARPPASWRTTPTPRPTPSPPPSSATRPTGAGQSTPTAHSATATVAESPPETTSLNRTSKTARMIRS